MLVPFLVTAFIILFSVLPALASQAEEQEHADPVGDASVEPSAPPAQTQPPRTVVGEAIDRTINPRTTEAEIEPEVATEVRFQKQCFLAYNTLKVHEKLAEYFRKQSEGLPGHLTNPQNYTIIEGAPSADITSLIVSRPKTESLMNIKPQLLSYLVPYIRLYKVYGAPRGQEAPPGAPVDNEEVEFVFDTHITRNDINCITSSRRGRPGGVGLESFGWEFQGVNPGEVENNIRANLNIHFNNMRDFERERVPPGSTRVYRFSDLIIPEPLHEASTVEEIEAQRLNFNPKFFRIKVVAGWAIPPNTGLEEETFERGGGIKSYEELRELIRRNKKVMYLNLIAHNLSFNEDGSVSLNAEYQAMVEGIFSSTDSDILRVVRANGEPTPLQSARARLEEIGDDVRELNRVDNAISEGREITIEVDGRRSIHFDPNDPDLEDEHEQLRDLQEDMARHRSDVAQVVALYERRTRAMSYSVLTRRLMASNRIFRIEVEPQALGFDSFPIEEGVERGHTAADTARQFDPAYSSLNGTGFRDPQRPGMSERAETFRPLSLDWYQAAAGANPDDPGVQAEDRRAREQMDLDYDLLRRMIAISRFYGGAQFTVRDISSNGAGEDSLGCGGLLSVISAQANLSGIGLDDAGQGDLANRMVQNEEQLARSIERMRNWVLFGTANIAGTETEGLRVEAETVPIDFMLFGDILDAAMQVDMPWLEDNNVEIFLGTFTFNDPAEYTPGQSGTTRSHSIPLAHIPISMELFSMWFLEEIVEPQRETMPLREFIRSIFNKLIVNAYGGECMFDPTGNFGLSQESLRVVPEFYTISKSKLVPAGLYRPRTPLSIVNFSTLQEVISNQELYMLDYDERNDNFEDYVSVVLYQASSENNSANFLHERNMEDSSTPYLDIVEQDIGQGVYHLNIGSDRGLVKTISFARMDQTYVRESRSVGAGEMDLAQIRDRYNATVNLYGNMFFYPGQYIFINPSVVGVSVVPELKALTTKLGIGGYFLITKVENIIERGLFETILTCSWTYSGFRIPSSRSSAADTQDGSGVTLSSHYRTTEPPSDIDTITGQIAEGLDDFGDWVLEVAGDR